MKPVEFDTRVLPGGTLRIPPELAEQISTDQQVHVTVAPAERDPEIVRRGIASTFGAWKADPSTLSIFDEIDRERHADLGREVELP